jgi:small subunit ribosomal protein S6
MFLVDSAQAAADWDGTLGVIENVLKRADAEVVSMRKWGERRLAYDIDHKGRGTYILCYFRADGSRIAGIEKDVQLSEKVMRVLVLGTEKRPPEVIEADMTGASQEQETPEAQAGAETAKEKDEAAEKQTTAPESAPAAESDSPKEQPAPQENRADEENRPEATAEAETPKPQEP